MKKMSLGIPLAVGMTGTVLSLVTGSKKNTYCIWNSLDSFIFSTCVSI